MMSGFSSSSAVLNLVKIIIGSGVIGVPWVFAQCGLVLGASLLIFCAAMEIFALHMLAHSVIQARGRGQDVSYHTLARAAFGGRQIASIAVTMCVTVCACGSIVSYLMIIGDLLPEVMVYCGIHIQLLHSRTFWITAIGWGIELPLSLPADMGALKISSIVGNAGILYMVVVISIFASGVVAVAPPIQQVSVWPPSKSAYTSMPGIMEALPMFVFAFDCAMCVPKVVVELGDVTMRAADKIIAAAVSITCVIYLAIGVAGSIAFGASVEVDSLKSFPNVQGTTGGLLSIFARLAIVVTVMGGIPLYMLALRSIFLQMMYGKASGDVGLPARAATSAVQFLCCWLLAMAIKSLDEVMAFVGATAQIMVGFSLPALFYLLGTSWRSQIDITSDFGIADTEGALDEHPSSARSLSMQKPSPGTYRRSALTMAVMSAILMPIFISGEVYKIMTESH